jgi:DNA-binding NarL/FixJ family response regulator
MSTQFQRVLVIQSVPELAAYTCALLDEIGFRHIIEANNPEQAEKLLKNANEKSRPFQLIICDDDIPGGALPIEAMSGNTPLLVISQAENPANLRLAARLGLRGMIFRPYGKSQVEVALRSVLKP